MSCSDIGMADTLLLFSLYVWFLNKHLLFVSLCWILVAHGLEESLVVAYRLFQLCRVGSSSLTRDHSWVPFTGNTES